MNLTTYTPNETADSNFALYYGFRSEDSETVAPNQALFATRELALANRADKHLLVIVTVQVADDATQVPLHIYTPDYTICHTVH